MASPLLFETIWQIQVTSYIWVSGLVVMTYDTILTFPLEVEYIWSAKWTLPKVLYIMLRYLGLFQTLISTIVRSNMQSSVQRCRWFFWFIVSAGSPAALLMIVNGILGLRLYALYGRNVKVLCFLWLIFLADFAVQAYISISIGRSTADNAFITPPDIPILGCSTELTNVSTTDIEIAWLVAIAVAVICLLMTVLKFFHSEADHSGWRIQRRFPPLARAFIQDGTVYFLAIVVILVAGTVSSSVTSGPFIVLYEPFMAVTLVIAGSRLVLHLREVACSDYSGFHNSSLFNSTSRATEIP